MLLLFSLAAALQSPAHATEGTWVLKSIYRTPNVQGPSPTEQRTLIGSEIVIGGTYLRACGQSVPIRSRSIHNLNADQFLFGTHVRFTDVGIDGPTVTEIVLNDGKAGRCFGAFPVPGQRLYVKSRSELLVDFEGTFYRAVRVN